MYNLLSCPLETYNINNITIIMYFLQWSIWKKVYISI